MNGNWYSRGLQWLLKSASAQCTRVALVLILRLSCLFPLYSWEIEHNWLPLFKRTLDRHSPVVSSAARVEAQSWSAVSTKMRFTGHRLVSAFFLFLLLVDLSEGWWGRRRRRRRRKSSKVGWGAEIADTSTSQEWGSRKSLLLSDEQ